MRSTLVWPRPVRDRMIAALAGQLQPCLEPIGITPLGTGLADALLSLMWRVSAICILLAHTLLHAHKLLPMLYSPLRRMIACGKYSLPAKLRRGGRLMYSTSFANLQGSMALTWHGGRFILQR